MPLLPLALTAGKQYMRFRQNQLASEQALTTAEQANLNAAMNVGSRAAQAGKRVKQEALSSVDSASDDSTAQTSPPASGYPASQMFISPGPDDPFSQPGWNDRR